MRKIKFQVDIKPMAKQSARFKAEKGAGSSRALTGSSISPAQYKELMSGAAKQKVTAFQTDKIKKYEEVIGYCAKMKMKGEPLLTGALGINITYVFEMTKSIGPNLQTKIKQGKKVYKITKPDLDSNLNKPVCDAINKIVYDDDSRICKISAEKIYGIADALIVEVYEMDVFYKSK